MSRTVERMAGQECGLLAESHQLRGERGRQFSAVCLAKNLLGGNAPVKLPAMLVKVKTPELPLHLAGETQRQDLDWQIALSPQGMVARGTDTDGQMRAFVVSEDRMKEAFALLKSLPA